MVTEGGDHGHLGRTAGKTAHNGIGDLDEEITDAGALQKGTEDDEHADELGADIDGGGEHALLGVEKGSHQHIQPPGKTGIGKTPDQGIDHKAARHDQNGQTHTAAADLSQGQNAHNADDNLISIKVAALLDDLIGAEGEVQECSGAQNHGHQIIPGHVIHFLGALLRRKHQKTHKYNAGHKRGQTDLLQPTGPQGYTDDKQGKRCQKQIDYQPGCTFPDAGVGFPVIFFHDRIQIHGLGRSGNRFLFKKCHGNPPLKIYQWLRRESRRSHWGSTQRISLRKR